MLRYKETEDIDARFSEVERAVAAWRQALPTANQVARTEFNNRLRISLIHHDAALEGEVLSYSEINRRGRHMPELHELARLLRCRNCGRKVAEVKLQRSFTRPPPILRH